MAAGSAMIVPRHVLGRGFVAPSDKLNIAGICAGGKGKDDLKHFAESPKVNIVGLCDVDEKKSRRITQALPQSQVLQGLPGNAGQRKKNNIDAVSVSTPDNVHAIVSISAMQLGKHVYCQKPLCHDIYEARLMAEAAKYIDYNPAYHPWSWRGWNAFGTGAPGDMACHMMDPVFRLLPIDFPTEVECSIPSSWMTNGDEAKDPDGFPAASKIHLKYPRKDGKGDIRVSWYDGGLLPQLPDELAHGEQFGGDDGGALFIGTKGKLMA